MCILFVYQLLSVANHYLRVYLGTVNVISFLTEAETVYLTVPILYNPAIVDDGRQLQVPDLLSESRFMTSRGLFSAVAWIAGIVVSMEDGVPLLSLAW